MPIPSTTQVSAGAGNGVNFASNAGITFRPRPIRPGRVLRSLFLMAESIQLTNPEDGANVNVTVYGSSSSEAPAADVTMRAAQTLLNVNVPLIITQTGTYYHGTCAVEIPFHHDPEENPESKFLTVVILPQNSGSTNDNGSLLMNDVPK